MEYNTVIIGSGVAGMTASMYLKRANISCCIIEKEMPGGQITRTSRITNYPGIENIGGTELAMTIYKQVEALKVPCIFDEVIEIEIKDDYKIVKTNTEEIKCQNIIIATGKSPRKLDVKGERKLIGNGISFCATCDASLYKDKKVAVIGGGESAFKETLFLSKICGEVTLIHRRDIFRANKTLVERVKSKENITILTNTVVTEFKENDGKLESLIIEENKTQKELKVDGCFEYIGEEPNTRFLSNLNILDDEGYVNIDKYFETDIKGIYAVGDCLKKDLYQVVIACSDGAIAANKISN